MSEAWASGSRGCVRGAALLIAATLVAAFADDSPTSTPSTQSESSTGDEALPPPRDDPAWQLAEAICRSLITCGCAGVADDEACTRGLASVFDIEHATVENTHLAHDQGCLQLQLEFFVRQGCQPRGAEQQACEDRCQLFHGDVEPGEPCQWYGNFHDCRQGLDCERVHGEDRCLPACGSAVGEPCPRGRCVDAAHCVETPGGEGICEPLPAVGDPCPHGGCPSDTFCSFGDAQESVCTPRARLGDPCRDAVCEHGAYCSFDLDDPVCVRFPVLGEPCPLGVCLWHDAVCDESLPEPMCVELRAEGEACEQPYECASSWCDDARCGTPPAAICRLRHLVPQ